MLGDMAPPSTDEFVGLGTWDLHSQHQKTPAQGPRPTILTRRTSQDLRAGPLHNECHSGGWGGGLTPAKNSTVWLWSGFAPPLGVKYPSRIQLLRGGSTGKSFATL